MVLRECTADPATLSSKWFQVRDWTVRTLVDNALAGTVHELLLDDQNIPRYLDVALNREGRHVLVPIGHGRADRVHQQVWLPGFAEYQFETIPSYEHAPLARGVEARLLNAYSATMAGALPQRGYRILGAAERRRIKREDTRRLVPLSEYPALRVAGGEADPRGWSVTDRTGTVHGTVADLLLDLAAMKVRYLICDLGADAVEARRVLVPVEFVRLDSGAEAAAVPSLSPELLSSLDAFDGEPPEWEQEALMLERFTETLESDDFYRHPRYDPDAFFGSA